MALRPTLAHINPDSPRADAWRRVFGGESVPVEMPVPVRAVAPDGEIRLFYKLRVAALSLAQRARLVAFLAGKFGVPIAEIEADLDAEHGCPILAEDVVVSFDARYAL